VQTALYGVVRRVLGVALGFYFRRIERFHAERVPVSGPVLFASNHPNSLADSFVIGSCVARKINFVATVQLFQFAPLKWLLRRCGVIPINRAKDDPRAMRTVAATFEACFGVLEAGEAVAIFPEGITYDDAQLKEVKSGAARMALELEDRHAGKLGLLLVPVGLTYSAKELYRSDVLANFGEPIRVAEFLAGYAERRKECITRLTGEIEARLRTLIVNTPDLERARVVGGVKRLYLDRLSIGGHSHPAPSPEARHGGAAELVLTQRIAAAVDAVFQFEPERAQAFSARLAWYEGWLRRLRLADEELAIFPDKQRVLGHSLLWAAVAILGAPLALYGWVHRLLPSLVVKWSVHRFAQPGKRKAQTATASIVSGAVAFGVFYAACVFVVHRLFGWPASLWYGVSLPVASLVAFYYWKGLRHWFAGLRTLWVLLRAPAATRHLLHCRQDLIMEIEAVHAGLASDAGAVQV
jgi:1-acyl-sn-glycerol-3-phosphate acyltransferase